MIIHCKFDALVDPKSLKYHPKNRNKHPKEQIERLAKILEYQGWRYAIKISNLSGFVTSGHGRIAAAIKNNWHEVPVVYQDYTDADQEYADVQADNAIASWSELDLSAINFDVPDLGPNFDIDMLGLKNFELEPADKYADKDADETSEIRKTDIKLGDLFQLGNHRLLCGDATDKANVEMLMKGEKADMVFTDPPYGINLDTDYSRFKNRGQKMRYIKNDRVENLNFDTIFAMKCEKVIWGANNFYWMLPQLEAAGWLCWDKRVTEAADKSFGSPFELAWTNRPRFFKIFRIQHGGAVNADYRAKEEIQEKRYHPTQKPILLAKNVFDGMRAGLLIVDLYLGSGTTLIACEKTNRKCFGMEIDPQYCQVIIDRWEKFTGQKAKKIG